ncbi:MAG: site-specific integrase [archaeon]
MGIDIHDFRKRLDSERRLLQEAKISERNRELILRFLDDCILTSSIGLARQSKMLYEMRMIASKLGKDFEESTAEDIRNLVKDLMVSELGAETIEDRKSFLKRFYKWLKRPELIGWIRRTKRAELVNREELYNPEEVYSLKDGADNLRDKLLVSLFWESGGRIGEVLGLRIKNVEDTPDGLILHVTGKMGRREIPYLQESVQLYRSYVQTHSHKDNPDAPLWYCFGNGRKKEVFDYSACARMLKRLGKKAGIAKNIRPHNFRKSRATYLASQGWSESMLNQFFGWREGSGTSAVYVRMCAKDLKNAMHSLYGKGFVEDRPKAVKCFNCNEVNPVGANFCSRCSADLNKDTQDIKSRDQWVKFQQVIRQTPEVVDILIDLMHKEKEKVIS